MEKDREGREGREDREILVWNAPYNRLVVSIKEQERTPSYREVVMLTYGEARQLIADLSEQLSRVSERENEKEAIKNLGEKLRAMADDVKIEVPRRGKVTRPSIVEPDMTWWQRAYNAVWKSKRRRQ